MSITIVVGNPKPASRTLEAASILAERISGRAPDNVIDVIGLGPSLLGWGDDGVKAAVATAASSDLLIVASPTYKGAYTGLLKLFLDKFESANGLHGVVAVPLMVGASRAHAMAPEIYLKPVLVELGATVPVQGLYLDEKTYSEESSTAPWLAQWKSVLLKLMARETLDA